MVKFQSTFFRAFTQMLSVLSFLMLGACGKLNTTIPNLDQVLQGLVPTPTPCVTITPVPVPSPTSAPIGAPVCQSFTASKTTLNPGEGSYLSARAYNANRTQIVGSDGSVLPCNTVVYPSVTTTYTAKAFNDAYGLSTSCGSITIIVNPVFAASLSLSSSQITGSGSITVSYTISGANTATLYGSNGTSYTLWNGSGVVNLFVSQTTTYTLVIVKADGTSLTRYATITVLPAPVPPVPDPTPTPTPAPNIYISSVQFYAAVKGSAWICLQHNGASDPSAYVSISSASSNFNASGATSFIQGTNSNGTIGSKIVNFNYSRDNTIAVHGSTWRGVSSVSIEVLRNVGQASGTTRVVGPCAFINHPNGGIVTLNWTSHL